MTLPLLTLLGIIPMVGSLLVFTLRGHTAKLVGLAFALVTTGAGIAAIMLQGPNDLSEQVTWIGAIGAHYALSLDGMAKVMVLVTIVLTPTVLVAEWDLEEAGETSDGWGAQAFVALVLLLEGMALFVFMAADVLLFYIVFEATLIPMYFLIGGWGGANRAAAAMKFLLYSLAGGLVMLAGVIGLIVASGRTGEPSLLIADLANLDLGTGLGRLAFLGFFFAFAIKAPMVPVHTWLPDVAEEATPGATVLLVGVLDKIGAYGMIRFCLGVFGEASAWADTAILVAALVSIIYGAFMAIASTNLMRMVAFTSISHFGFMIFGIFAMTTASITGSVVYLLAHGLSFAALFLVAAFLVRRAGTADIGAFGGVARMAPVLAGLFLVAGLATLALPGFTSFVGEFLVMAGGWQRYPVLTAIAALGTVLAAVYVMLVYQRTMTGEPTAATLAAVGGDLALRERVALAPLIALLLIFGFWPAPITELAGPTAAQSMTSIGIADPLPTVSEGK